MATLQSYITATQRLLHDANAKVWTIPTLIDAINGAQKRAVGDSGCNRQLQTIYLSGGLELYGVGSVSGALITNSGSGYVTAPVVTVGPPPAGGTQAVATSVLLNGTVGQIQFTTGGSGYLTAPTVTIAPPPAGVTATATATILNPQMLDALNITVLWGSERVILNRMSFTQFQASVRSWTGYTQRPGWVAKYGQDQWYLGPIPDQFYISEWDSIITPQNLVNMSDVSVIKYPYEECVPYYAAHTCKFQEQSYAEADKFLVQYQNKMRYSLRSVQMRILPSAYGNP